LVCVCVCVCVLPEGDCILLCGLAFNLWL